MVSPVHVVKRPRRGRDEEDELDESEENDVDDDVADDEYECEMLVEYEDDDPDSSPSTHQTSANERILPDMLSRLARWRALFETYTYIGRE